MLTELTLENFRGFRGKKTFPLGKITLLYGANSAGKSAILNAISLLGQNEVKEPVHPRYSLPFRRQSFSRGTFESTISDHNVELPLRVGFSFKEEVSRGIRFGSSSKTFRTIKKFPLGIEFEYIYKELDYSHSNNNILNNIKLFSPIDPTINPVNITKDLPVDFVNDYTDRDYFDLDSDESLWIAQINNAENKPNAHKRSVAFYIEDIFAFFNLLNSNLLWEKIKRSSAIRFSGDQGAEGFFLSEKFVELMRSCRISLESKDRPGHFFSIALDPYEIFDIFPQYTEYLVEALGACYEFIEGYNSHLNILDNLVYLGPHRAPPARYSFRQSHTEESLSLKNNLFPYFVQDQDQISQVNEWLSKLKLPYELKIETIDNKFTGPIDTPILTDLRNKKEHSLADVGYGYSQILPIISLLPSEREQLVFIEQPELHLHPKLQADLAEFFISAVKDPEDKRQWIIETHSEAIMLRIQRRIREGKLDHNDVSVLYIGNFEDEGSVVEPLRLDKNGEFLDEWPGGFFEENFDELFGLD